jgi:predicted PurR-regulated permease PerM
MATLRRDEAAAVVQRLRVMPVRRMLVLAAAAMTAALLVLGGAWIALELGPVLLVVVVALFLVGTLNPAVEWCEKKGLGRGKSIGIVFVVAFLSFAGLLALAIPALLQQMGALAEAAPKLQERLADVLSRSRATQPLAETIRTFHYEALARAQAGAAFHYSTRAIGIFAYLMSSIFLALYILIDRDRLRGGVYAMVPRSHHIRLSRILLNLETIVGGYIRGQVVTSALMGTFTFVLLLVCGVKNPLAIGVLAGIADVLPYIGVALALGAAVGAAVARGAAIAIAVLIAMLIYEEFESRFLVPRVYGRVLKLPSSIVLVSLLAGGTLMGIPGALLALPVAAAIRMMVAELRVELPGEDVDHSRVLANDERAEKEYEKRAGGVPAQMAAAIAVEIEKKRDDDRPSTLLP